MTKLTMEVILQNPFTELSKDEQTRARSIAQSYRFYGGTAQTLCFHGSFEYTGDSEQIKQKQVDMIKHLKNITDMIRLSLIECRKFKDPC